MDGGGVDTLQGGAGADIFVLERDGQPDVIADFELGVDRLDLTLFGRFYTLEALDITPFRWGAEVRFGQEVVRLRSADGGRLRPEDFTLEDFRDLDHVAGAPLPALPQKLTGSAAADLLIGREGADTLSGGGGRDQLRGGGGDDCLYGEGATSVDMISAQVVRLYHATLDRAPDVIGLMDWSQRLAEGQLSLSEAAGGFLGSQEFLTTYGNTTNGEFVDLLYQNVLGRSSDAAGMEYWLGQLAQGSRSRVEVVQGFAQSAEFIQRSDPDLLAWMRGAGRDDLLEGGAGDDILRGGMLADQFVFEAGAGGRDQVLDLERWDLIQFNSFGYGEVEAALAHFRPLGEDLLFSDQGVEILFTRTTLSDVFTDMLIL